VSTTKIAFAWAGGFAALVLLVIGLNWVGLFANRPMAKYQTETDKQVYDTSRQYQQGTQLDLSRYCAQYHAAEGAAKTAVAGLIRDTAATYSGPLTENNQACLSEIGQ
jgi:hypothetical protein